MTFFMWLSTLADALIQSSFSLLLSEIVYASHWFSQSNSVPIRGRWWTVRAQCALKQGLRLERWCVSPVTKIISWKDPARSPAMEETLATPNGVIAAQNVSVSPFSAHSYWLLVFLLFSFVIWKTCFFFLASKIWSMHKPWCSW